MVRGSSGKKKSHEATNEERKSHYLLCNGEDSTPLVEFLSGLGSDILSSKLPRGELPTAPRDIPAMLIPPAQDILFRLIHVVVHEMEAGYTIKPLSDISFCVTRLHLVKLNQNVTEATAPVDKTSTIHRLRLMLDRLLQATSPSYLANRKVNPELSHLLGLMKDYQYGSPTLYLIKYPFCLLPLSNRAPAYIKFYDHTMDIIRFNNPGAYLLIVDNVEFPQNWQQTFATNQHLADSLGRGEYDSQTAKTSTFEPQLCPFKILRHRPSHAQEGAASPSDPRGMRYSPSDLATAMYIRMPYAFVSFQKSLHFVGELENIDGFLDLFPGRVILPGVP